MRGIVFGSRAAKTVRTYNYKRETVTDHRTGVVVPLKKALDGDISLFIEANKKRAVEQTEPEKELI